MFWSVVLLCLRECVDDSIEDVARRLRKAKSKRKGEEDESPEKGVKEKDSSSDKIDEEIDTDSKEWREKQQKQSFEKVLAGNSWIMTALRDAIEYAKEDTSKARDHKILDVSSRVMKSSQSFIESFAEEILPALNSRGWKNEGPSNSNRKYELISPHGNIVSERITGQRLYTI